jgi:hypothetical protein
MFTNVLNWMARRLRRTVLGLILAALIVTAAVWLIRVSERAESLAAELRATGSLAETALASTDPSKIEEMSISLNASLRSGRDLDEDLWPLRWAGTVVGRIPVIGDNVTAVSDLVGRLNDDLSAALALTDAAEVLVTAYGDLSSRDVGLIDTLQALPTESEIMSATLLIDEAERLLTRAETTASTMDDGRLFGRVGRESEELGIQEARVREVIEWAGLSAKSLLALARLSETSLTIVGLLDSEDSTGVALGRDALSAMPELAAAARDAHLTVASANARIPSGIAGSEIGDVLLGFEPVLGALVEIARAGILTWTALSPVLDEMESSPGGLIGEGTSILGALEILKDRKFELQEARLILDSVASDLRSVELRSQTAVSAVNTLSDASAELAHAVGFLSDFSEIGSQILGSDGPQRYLVLGQTSDELRGSGGFVSAAWILTFDDGQMSNIRYHDIVAVDDQDRLDLYPLPPELLAQHMDAPVWLLRDATWSPEFPAAARTAAEIFELGQGGLQVDGVIALTEWAIVGLVAALGTVDTDIGEMTSEELLPALESGTDAEGRAFVDTIFRSVLDELRSPGVTDRLFGIARAASDMLNRKDVMVYMFDPALQGVIARSGWDGSLGRPEGDRIAVIDSNIGWNKVDRNIERSLQYHVALRQFEPIEARLTLSYRNTSGLGSRGCDIQSPIHDLSYAEMRQSCYWNLVRVYVPDKGSLVSSNPLPIPAGSVYARVAAGLPGDDSVNIGVDSGGKFISGLIAVPAGETMTSGFNVIVPEDALISDGDMLTYRLTLTAQAGALGRDALIRLDLPSGFELLSSSITPTAVSGRVVEFALRIEFDTTIEVRMQRSSAVAGHASDGGSIGQAGVSVS